MLVLFYYVTDVLYTARTLQYVLPQYFPWHDNDNQVTTD